MAKKIQIKQKTTAGTVEILHPETSADLVKVGSGRTVQQELNDALPISAGRGISLKQNSSGAVEFSVNEAELGSNTVVAANAPLSVASNKDTATNTTTYTISIGDASTTQRGVVTIAGDWDKSGNSVPTASAVKNYVGQYLASAMMFKGTVGVNGTVSALPAMSAAKVGDTYKVVSTITVDGKSAYAGDTVVCAPDANPQTHKKWEIIPSGDDIAITTAEGTAPLAPGGKLVLQHGNGLVVQRNDAANTISVSHDANAKHLPSAIGSTGQILVQNTASGASWQSLKASSESDIDISAVPNNLVLKLKNITTAGTYSNVTVNSKGLVTGGNQIMKYYAANATPQPESDYMLAVGGIAFVEIQ